jgi:hypothetical protein
MPRPAEILKYEERLVGMTDIPAPRDRRHVGGSLFFTIERATRRSAISP